MRSLPFVWYNSLESEVIEIVIPIIISAISLSLGLIALLAPSLTALINNKHAVRMRELDLQQQKYEAETLHIKKSFSEFLNSYGVFMGKMSTDNLKDLKGSFYKISPYIPEKNIKEFRKFIAIFSSSSDHWSSSEAIMFEKIIPAIQDIIEQL